MHQPAGGWQGGAHRNREDREELTPAAWEVSEFEGTGESSKSWMTRVARVTSRSTRSCSRIVTPRGPAWASVRTTERCPWLSSALRSRFIYPRLRGLRPRLDSPQTYSDPSAAWKPLFGSQPESGGWSLSL